MLHGEYGRELFPWCEQNGTAVLAYGPLAYGLLTGKIGMDTEFAEDDWRRGQGEILYWTEFFEPEARRRAPGEDRAHGADRGPARASSMSQLALAWVVPSRA